MKVNGEKIFVYSCMTIFFPFVILGFIFDVITKGRTLYINIDTGEIHLGEFDE